MLGEPRHNVESKLIIVDTEAEDFVSGVVVVVFTPGVPETNFYFFTFVNISNEK